MRRADVAVTLHRQGSAVRADVRCRFVMDYSHASAEPAQMAFPVFATGDGVLGVTDFSVNVDGKDVASVLPVDEWRAREGDSLVYRAFRWTSPAPHGHTQIIVVTYTITLPADDAGALLRYVVRSGSLWDRPIGKEIVTVSFPADLWLALPVEGLCPRNRSERLWTWELVNARPTADVLVVVLPR